MIRTHVHVKHLPPTIAMLAAALVTAAASSAGAQSRWVLEAVGMGAAPVDPQAFRDGWRAGLGIGGSLRVRLGVPEVGVDAEYVQFGFDGLDAAGPLGGERRSVRLAVPVRVALWKDAQRTDQALYAQASAGWGRQSIAGTFGGSFTTPPATEDGFAWSMGLRYARQLYRATKWSIGLRYTRFEYSNESPSFVSLLLAIQMPLDGSRPPKRNADSR